MFDSEYAAFLCRSGNDKVRQFAHESKWAHDNVKAHRVEIEGHIRTIARLEAEIAMLKQILKEEA